MSKLTLTFGFYYIFTNKSFDKSGKPNYFSNFYFFQSAMPKFKFCDLHRDDRYFIQNKQLKALFLTKEPKKCQKFILVPNYFLWSQDVFKRAKKCQIFLKVPNQNFWCQTDLKRARFVNSGSKKSQITTLPGSVCLCLFLFSMWCSYRRSLVQLSSVCFACSCHSTADSICFYQTALTQNQHV